MQLCFDATRFGLGLFEAVELAAQKGLAAVEYSFQPFAVSGKTTKLALKEKEYLTSVLDLCRQSGVRIACLKLAWLFDAGDKAQAKTFQHTMARLALVAGAVECSKIAFFISPTAAPDWLDVAAEAIAPVASDLAEKGIRLLLNLETPEVNRGTTLKRWRPLEPAEWRDLIAHVEGLSLAFSAADCVWQNIDYLQILPYIVTAIEHVAANDVEINRSLLSDSGLFGPLWWRYRSPGKGQIDWRQLIEALKLYDYHGSFSIRLDDEFVAGTVDDLESSLDESIKLFKPLLK